MKRKLVTLVTLLMACTLMVCLAYATTSSKTATGYYEKTYLLTSSGSSSKLTAQGTDTKSISTLRNTSTSTIYSYVKVTCKNYNNGLTVDSNGKTSASLAANSNVTISIDRDTNNALLEYIHYGKACKYTSPTNIIDELTYTVTQR